MKAVILLVEFGHRMKGSYKNIHTNFLKKRYALILFPIVD